MLRACVRACVPVSVAFREHTVACLPCGDEQRRRRRGGVDLIDRARTRNRAGTHPHTSPSAPAVPVRLLHPPPTRTQKTASKGTLEFVHERATRERATWLPDSGVRPCVWLAVQDGQGRVLRTCKVRAIRSQSSDFTDTAPSEPSFVSCTPLVLIASA